MHQIQSGYISLYASLPGVGFHSRDPYTMPKSIIVAVAQKNTETGTRRASNKYPIEEILISARPKNDCLPAPRCNASNPHPLLPSPAVSSISGGLARSVANLLYLLESVFVRVFGPLARRIGVVLSGLRRIPRGVVQIAPLRWRALVVVVVAGIGALVAVRPGAAHPRLMGMANGSQKLAIEKECVS